MSSRRHTSRKLAMQALYQGELRSDGANFQEIIQDFLTDSQYQEETKVWASELASEVWKSKDDLDDLIQRYAIGWELGRITPVDKSILRLAFYELKYIGLAPTIVVDEAVEIAKRYSSEESYRFINGILGQYVKEVIKV